MKTHMYGMPGYGKFIKQKNVDHYYINMNIKCVICKRKLKITEINLCSCDKNICFKHKDKISHNCSISPNITIKEKIVAIKVNKI